MPFLTEKGVDPTMPRAGDLAYCASCVENGGTMSWTDQGPGVNCDAPSDTCATFTAGAPIPPQLCESDEDCASKSCKAQATGGKKVCDPTDEGVNCMPGPDPNSCVQAARPYPKLNACSLDGMLPGEEGRSVSQSSGDGFANGARCVSCLDPACHSSTGAAEQVDVAACCKNGTADESLCMNGADGASQGGACKSCDEGYELDAATKTCEEKTCTCANGVGAKGAACSDAPCASCNTGYVLDNDTNTCERVREPTAVGRASCLACVESGGVFTADAPDKGEDSSCESLPPEQCTGGVAATPTFCNSDDECDSGKCIAVKSADGLPLLSICLPKYNGINCELDLDNKCRSVYRTRGTCNVNTPPEEGTQSRNIAGPATKAFQDGLADCVSCDDVACLDGNDSSTLKAIDIDSHCKCDNGTKDMQLCVHSMPIGSSVCGKCDEGYELDTETHKCHIKPPADPYVGATLDCQACVDADQTFEFTEKTDESAQCADVPLEKCNAGDVLPLVPCQTDYDCTSGSCLKSNDSLKGYCGPTRAGLSCAVETDSDGTQVCRPAARAVAGKCRSSKSEIEDESKTVGTDGRCVSCYDGYCGGTVDTSVLHSFDPKLDCSCKNGTTDSTRCTYKNVAHGTGMCGSCDEGYKLDLDTHTCKKCTKVVGGVCMPDDDDIQACAKGLARTSQHHYLPYWSWSLNNGAGGTKTLDPKGYNDVTIDRDRNIDAGANYCAYDDSSCASDSDKSCTSKETCSDGCWQARIKLCQEKKCYYGDASVPETCSDVPDDQGGLGCLYGEGCDDPADPSCTKNKQWFNKQHYPVPASATHLDKDKADCTGPLCDQLLQEGTSKVTAVQTAPIQVSAPPQGAKGAAHFAHTLEGWNGHGLFTNNQPPGEPPMQSYFVSHPDYGEVTCLDANGFPGNCEKLEVSADGHLLDQLSDPKNPTSKVVTKTSGEAQSCKTDSDCSDPQPICIDKKNGVGTCRPDLRCGVTDQGDALVSPTPGQTHVAIQKDGKQVGTYSYCACDPVSTLDVDGTMAFTSGARCTHRCPVWTGDTLVPFASNTDSMYQKLARQYDACRGLSVVNGECSAAAGKVKQDAHIADAAQHCVVNSAGTGCTADWAASSHSSYGSPACGGADYGVCSQESPTDTAQCACLPQWEMIGGPLNAHIGTAEETGCRPSLCHNDSDLPCQDYLTPTSLGDCAVQDLLTVNNAQDDVNKTCKTTIGSGKQTAGKSKLCFSEWVQDTVLTNKPTPGNEWNPNSKGKTIIQDWLLKAPTCDDKGNCDKYDASLKMTGCKTAVDKDGNDTCKYNDDGSLQNPIQWNMTQTAFCKCYEGSELDDYGKCVVPPPEPDCLSANNVPQVLNQPVDSEGNPTANTAPTDLSFMFVAEKKNGTCSTGTEPVPVYGNGSAKIMSGVTGATDGHANSYGDVFAGHGGGTTTLCAPSGVNPKAYFAWVNSDYDPYAGNCPAGFEWEGHDRSKAGKSALPVSLCIHKNLARTAYAATKDYTEPTVSNAFGIVSSNDDTFDSDDFDSANPNKTCDKVLGLRTADTQYTTCAGKTSQPDCDSTEKCTWYDGVKSHSHTATDNYAPDGDVQARCRPTGYNWVALPANTGTVTDDDDDYTFDNRDLRTDQGHATIFGCYNSASLKALAAGGKEKKLAKDEQDQYCNLKKAWQCEKNTSRAKGNIAGTSGDTWISWQSDLCTATHCISGTICSKQIEVDV